MTGEAPNPIRVSVVIPCRNEEASIGTVVQAAREGLAKMKVEGEIIVVNNGSTDATAERARAVGARVIDEPRPGYGSAIRRGFAAACGEVLVMGDGDASYDFTQMHLLVEPVLEGRCDFAIGNRMKRLRKGSMPLLHRHLGNPLLSGCLALLFRSRRVRDAHCGMRAIRRDAYQSLGCATTGMEFASEMVIAALRKPLRIEEHDIDYHPRIGRSKLRTFRDGWRHLRFMLLHSPAALLLAPGTFFWLLSMALAMRLAAGPIAWGERLIDVHAMLLAGLLNIVSLQVMTLGMLAKASAHIRGVNPDPVIAWFYRWFTYEKLMLIALAGLVAGLGLCGHVIYQWAQSGFGPLDHVRPLFFGALALVNGVQLAAAGHVFSVLALPVDTAHTAPTYQRHER